MIKFDLDNYDLTKSQLNSIRVITHELDRIDGEGYYQEDDYVELDYITIDLGPGRNYRLLITRRGKIINADHPELSSKQAVARIKKELK